MQYYLSKSGAFYKAPESFQNPFYFYENDYIPQDDNEAIAFAEWLRTHTEKKDVKRLVIRYYASLSVSDPDYHGPSNRVEVLLLKYNFPIELVTELYESLHLIKITRAKDLDRIVNLLVAEFLQEFACVDIEDGHATVYTGSARVNWFKPLHNEWPERPSTITVCRPGVPYHVYMLGDLPLKDVPFDEFMRLPICDLRRNYECKLARGAALCTVYNTVCPASIIAVWRKACDVEIRKYYKEIK